MVHPLIVLFPPEATDFSTNGLGSLGEAISCVVTEEANGSFELELVYPIFGRRYKDITLRSIIFTKPNPVDPPQAFRVYEISRPMDGQVTFYAEHISYDLSGYPVKPFSAANVGEAMNGLKAYSAVTHGFTFGTDKTTVGEFRIDAPASIRACLGGSEGSILDLYGGEYKFDNFNVYLYNNRGADRGVTIRYGKNLTDLTQDENNANVYTGVMPYWFDQNEGTLVQASGTIVPAEGTYNYTKILVADASSDYQEQPTPADLVAWAKTYIANNNIGKPEVSLDVSFEQLERFEEYETLTLLERVELFDTVHVEFPDLNVSSTAKISKTVYDCINHKYESVTIGEVRASISDTVASQGDTIKEEMTSGINNAIQEATNWITNGRGYMVANKNEAGQWMEICSLDDPNINEALNVWRWNNGGFGHSSHGYAGPYDTAITQDGKIVANAISAGVLKSINGTTFYLDLEKGTLTTNQMTANNITANGAFKCGPASNQIEFTNDGRMVGSENGAQAGYIDFSAHKHDINTGRRASGIQMTASGCIRISSPEISTAASSNYNTTTYKGFTGTITQWMVVPGKAGSMIVSMNGYLSLQFINGLLTGYTITEQP